MTEYHHGPYHHMSPSGFIALIIAIGLIAGFLTYLPVREAVTLVGGILVFGILAAVFFRKYFRRQSSTDQISLLSETKQEFEHVPNKLSLSYEMIMQDNLRKKTCPFCKNDFRQIDKIIACKTCNAIHHLDCWNDNSGCAIFGCEGKKATVMETH